MDIKPYDFGAGNLKATKAPMLFIHGDACPIPHTSR
jgi:hypothetical protein